MTERLERAGPVPKTGLVHIGPGAFFRAFNAVYTDEAMTAAGGNWGITAVSLRSATARDQLVPQGGVFTSLTLGTERHERHVIGAITRVLVAPESPDEVLAAMVDPAVQVVSLTVTEKGYCHNPATGRLQPDHPDIVHDLAHMDNPRSAPGFLVAALARRRAEGLRAFTVLSCDNLPSNGHVVRGVVLDLARALDPDLADWIAAEARFPATMVDRITPATTEADIAALSDAAGYLDLGMVAHERFRQWVIEDDFVSGRPAWDKVGAQFVRDVSAHETMKLRCLNGTHSTLAYLGYLAGFETVAEAVADANMAAMIWRLWTEEIVPTVPPPEGENLPAYCNALMDRYQDRAIRHRTWQIAMDGSQKLPQRLLGTIKDRLDAGAVPEGLCLAVAAWMRYVGGVDEAGGAIDVRDPLAERLRAASDSASDAAGKVAALLEIRDVFDADLAGDARFVSTVTGQYERLTTKGALAAVAAYLSGPSA